MLRFLQCNDCSKTGEHRYVLAEVAVIKQQAAEILSESSDNKLDTRGTSKRRLEESEITGELENGVDLRNRFGAILFCRITKDLCLGSIANDQVLPHGPDLNSLFENRGSWGKLLDPAEKQLMGYRRQ